MTEVEWLSHSNPQSLLEFIKEYAGSDRCQEHRGRKLRLFGCACCRRVWHLLPDERSRLTIEIAELNSLDWDCDNGSISGKCQQDAEEVVNKTESWAARKAARAAADVGVYLARPRGVGVWETPHQRQRRHQFNFQQICGVAKTAAEAAALNEYGTQPDRLGIELREQACLLRHLFGNPYRPYPTPAAWPTVVADLAYAVERDECSPLILADALEESGHSELADHFRREDWHPKGCWAVDLILGKS